MTTAARPTWAPAQGGTGKLDGGLGSLSQQYSVRDMPGHTKLKFLKPEQKAKASEDLKAELEQREKEAQKKRVLDRGGVDEEAALQALEAPDKRPRMFELQDPNLDADDDDEEDDESEEEDDEDDDDDDTADLLRELQKIKRERAEEAAKKEAEIAMEQERVRSETVMKGNPLLSSEFTVKRRWDDDVVFKNCARQEDREKEKRFVNDTLRSDFHRRFMDKYVW